MIDSQYSSLITNSGHTANIQAKALGLPIVFDEVAFGSGGLIPNEDATVLVSEEIRVKVHSVVQNQTDSNVLEIEAVIPADVGGFTINEAALYLDDGTLYAVSSIPESYKPILEQGAGKEFLFVFFLSSVGVENVALSIDGGSSFVTTNYLTNELKKYALINGDETKTFKVADAQNNNEAVNKKQLDELEIKLTDSIETIKDYPAGSGGGGINIVNNPYSGAFGSGKFRIFANSENFEVPETSIRVRCFGGGGAGSGGSSGGGGGGFAIKTINGLTIGETIPVTVGIGSVSGSGIAGGTSSFGSYVSATGGGAGSATNGVSALGGNGIGGDINYTGGKGGVRQDSFGSGGGGVANLLGNGGNGGSNNAGSSGASGGGGGTGSSSIVFSGGDGFLGTGALITGVNTVVSKATIYDIYSIDLIGTGGGGSGGQNSNAGFNGGGGGAPYSGSGGCGGGAFGGSSEKGGNGLVIVEW